MKSEKNIFIAFILNFFFSIFEFIGGILTGSVAIMSDSIHDLGDSLSICTSFVLEKKSKKEPDDKYTYGYLRYSVLGSAITTMILLVGSSIVIYNAIVRIINPLDINYNGMIIFALVGVVVNFIAAYFTKEGDSLNQKAVNLHMLEDVLGWGVVLIGAVIMKFTDIRIIDPILSILVAVFIFVNAIKGFKAIIDLFLEKTPCNIDINELREHLIHIENVIGVHHIHVWSIDGFNNYATLHAIVKDNPSEVKKEIKEELKEHNINHVTIEIEYENEECSELECHPHCECNHHHHHHHH